MDSARDFDLLGESAAQVRVSAVGETARTARVRLAEHHSHARYGHLNMSAVAEHALCEGHDIDWKSAKILDREKKRRSRQVKEALWIKQKKTTLNKD